MSTGSVTAAGPGTGAAGGVAADGVTARAGGVGRRALPVAAVRIADPFWSPRLQVLRDRTLPHLHRQLREVGQLDALRLTWRPGEGRPPHIFWDSDVAKWIEAASYLLATDPDPELSAQVDEAIELLAGAQQADGYLNSHYTVVDQGHFTDLRDGHELYCAGHLIEAAVAHHQATGKDSLLRIVCRYADLIGRVLGPGGSAEGGYPGHPELELALVKLARETGERRYLDLAAQLVRSRGRQPFFFEAEAIRRGDEGYFGSYFTTRPSEPERFRRYNLSHQPVVDQEEVVGHAVRAMYLYCAMADLAAECGDVELARACRRLWRNLADRKLYITGAVGSDDDLEAFGPDYDLPTEGGYRETCASIGLVMWARRMTLLTGDAAYMDVAEQALYNTVLASASTDGQSYFYDNPLTSDGTVHRKAWFGVACCPPNLARLLGSLGTYAYSASDREAVIDLFISGTAQYTFDGVPVDIEVSTGYPWQGRIEVRVRPRTPVRFALALRVPGWAGGDFALDVCGARVEPRVADGYVRVEREWSAGDAIVLTLAMRGERVWASPRVAATAGRVALRRGPLVYCVEGLDNEGPAAGLSIDADGPVSTWTDGAAGELGVVGLSTPGLRDTDDDAELYRREPAVRVPTRVRAVPYFCWGNRGESTMRVWLRDG